MICFVFKQMSKSILMVIAKDNHIGCSEQYVMMNWFEHEISKKKIATRCRCWQIGHLWSGNTKSDSEHINTIHAMEGMIVTKVWEPNCSCSWGSNWSPSPSWPRCNQSGQSLNLQVLPMFPPPPPRYSPSTLLLLLLLLLFLFPSLSSYSSSSSSSSCFSLYPLSVLMELQRVSVIAMEER